MSVIKSFVDSLEGARPESAFGELAALAVQMEDRGDELELALREAGWVDRKATLEGVREQLVKVINERIEALNGLKESLRG